MEDLRAQNSTLGLERSPAQIFPEWLHHPCRRSASVDTGRRPPEARRAELSWPACTQSVPSGRLRCMPARTICNSLHFRASVKAPSHPREAHLRFRLWSEPHSDPLGGESGGQDRTSYPLELSRNEARSATSSSHSHGGRLPDSPSIPVRRQSRSEAH